MTTGDDNSCLGGYVEGMLQLENNISIGYRSGPESSSSDITNNNGLYIDTTGAYTRNRICHFMVIKVEQHQH